MRLQLAVVLLALNPLGFGQSARTIEVVNQCSQPVWLGVLGAPASCNATESCKAGGNATCSDPKAGGICVGCKSDADCFDNQICHNPGGVGAVARCVHKNPAWTGSFGTAVTPARSCATDDDCGRAGVCGPNRQCMTGGWMLDAAGPTPPVPVQLSVGNAWGGKFWARTSCKASGDGFFCDSGDCGGNLACRPDMGGDAPATLAEFKMNAFTAPPSGSTKTDAADFYDVSDVDGHNVPVQITPLAGTFLTPDPNNIFDCGSPGNPAAVTSGAQTLQGCPWDLDAGSCPADMRFVATDPGVTAQACTADSDCPSGSICGVKAGVKSKACGRYAGCIAPQKACSFDVGPSLSLGCQTTVTIGTVSGPRSDLFACAGAFNASCFKDGAANSCCGCPSWAPPAPNINSCKNTNATWTDLAETTPFPPARSGYVKLFHETCPTAYGFPFDDTISTFTCKGTAADKMPGYRITFCPQPAIKTTSSASLGPAVSRGSIATLFGAQLAGPAAAASTSDLPVQLSGTSVTVADGSHTRTPAPLYYASPTQLNLVIPETVAAGPATIEVNRGALGAALTAAVNIRRIAPAIFTASANGAGVAAAYLQQADGTITITFADGGAAVPVDVSSGKSFLVLFGTGLRLASNIDVQIGGVTFKALTAYRQSQFPGLDQVNVGPLPASLGGATLPITVTADGVAANPVSIVTR